MPVPLRRLKKVLAHFSKQTLLVVGDLMLDEYIQGRVARISPEAPVPVLEVTGDSICELGGAGNVVRNLRELGGRVIPVGVVGGDEAGEQIRQRLASSGGGGVFTDPARTTSRKTRVLANRRQQLCRLDRDSSGDVGPGLEQAILRFCREALPRADAVIVSDYAKGVVTPKILRAVIDEARRLDIPVGVDPKFQHLQLRFYRSATVITPNKSEAERAAGIVVRTSKDLDAVARSILARAACQYLLVTRGEEGMSLFERNQPRRDIRALRHEVFDVTGAGDTVIATLMLAYASGASIDEAAEIANHAASVVVGKLGAATVSPEELLQSFK